MVKRVDVQVVRLDLGVLGSDLCEDPLPDVVAEAQRVGLVRHGHARATVLPRVLERRSNDPLDTLACVDVFLDRDLVGGAFLEDASHPDVEAFGVLAEDDEVDVLSLEIPERAKTVVEATNRPQVHEQVEPEPGAEQDVAGMAHVRYARIAQRTHEDRVEGLELLQCGVRKRLSGFEKPFRTVIEMFHLEFERHDLGGGLEDLDRLSRHVHTDPVAGKHRVSPLHVLPRQINGETDT